MRRPVLGALAAVTVLLAGCSSAAGTASSGISGSGSAPVTLPLGFLANITHASALIGVQKGLFNGALGSAGKRQTTVYNSGTQETAALLAGQLDAAYVSWLLQTLASFSSLAGTRRRAASAARRAVAAPLMPLPPAGSPWRRTR